MGIKYLKKFLKTKYPESCGEDDISVLRGTSLIVDSPGLLYKYKYSCKGKEWINLLIYFLLKAKSLDISLIFCMEGKAPVEKIETIYKRKKDRDSSIKRTFYLESLLKNYNETNEISNDLKSEWEIIKSRKKNLSESFNPEEFKQLLKKRMQYVDDIDCTDYKLFVDVLTIFGIPCITEHMEAETLCCIYKKRNIIENIYSQDTDTIAYKGINKVITDINFKTGKISFIDKEISLQKLGLSEDSFIDFCIMCGTDYNKTIKGVGIVTALKLIKANNMIDKTIDPYDILKSDWMRSFFNLQTFDNIETNCVPVIPNDNKSKIQTFLNDCNIKFHYNVQTLLADQENFEEDEKFIEFLENLKIEEI